MYYGGWKVELLHNYSSLHHNGFGRLAHFCFQTLPSHCNDALITLGVYITAVEPFKSILKVIWNIELFGLQDILCFHQLTAKT